MASFEPSRIPIQLPMMFGQFKGGPGSLNYKKPVSGLRVKRRGHLFDSKC
jgi:hypothetical protein